MSKSAGAIRPKRSRASVDAAKRQLFSESKRNEELNDHENAKSLSRVGDENTDNFYNLRSRTKVNSRFGNEDVDVEKSTVSWIGISISILCVCVVFLSLVIPDWLMVYFESKIEDREGQLYIHFKNNQRVYIIGLVMTTLMSTLCALLCCSISWTVTYFDRLDPGRNPPTPISPSKYRRDSGHTFHSSYITSLLNSLAVACYVLWWRRYDYMIL